MHFLSILAFLLWGIPTPHCNPVFTVEINDGAQKKREERREGGKKGGRKGRKGGSVRGSEGGRGYMQK